MAGSGRMETILLPRDDNGRVPTLWPGERTPVPPLPVDDAGPSCLHLVVGNSRPCFRGRPDAVRPVALEN